MTSSFHPMTRVGVCCGVAVLLGALGVPVLAGRDAPPHVMQTSQSAERLHTRR